MASRELCRLELPEFTIRENAYPAGARLSRHAHDYTSVTAVITGDIEEITEAGEHHGRSCSVLIKPAGTLHANLFLGTRPTRTISIQIKSSSPIATALTNWSWKEDPASARAALRLRQALGSSSIESVDAAAHDLIAKVTPRPDAHRAPEWLPEVIGILNDQFDRSLRFEEISHRLGLHPVYLSRAFHRHTGTSMGDYVRSLRLRHARHLLSATERSIGAIAADAGFSDPSHLSRTFIEAHNVSPRTYRRLCREV